MSRYAHKTKTSRKIITLQEWGVFVGMTRQTVANYLKGYLAVGNSYDPGDIYSILRFYQFLLRAKN